MSFLIWSAADQIGWNGLKKHKLFCPPEVYYIFIFFFAINYLVHTLTIQNVFSVAPKRSKLPVPDAIDTKVCSTTQTTRSTGIAAPRAAGRKSLEVATRDSSLRASGHVIYDACWIQQKHSKARCNGERWNSPPGNYGFRVPDLVLGRV